MPILPDAGAPPCLIQVDEDEVLFDDSRNLVVRLHDQGVIAELTTSKGRSHVWHLNVGRCPEADSSIAEIGAFIQKHVASLRV